jgi:hypothetical protein
MRPSWTVKRMKTSPSGDASGRERSISCSPAHRLPRVPETDGGYCQRHQSRHPRVLWKRDPGAAASHRLQTVQPQLPLPKLRRTAGCPSSRVRSTATTTAVVRHVGAAAHSRPCPRYGRAPGSTPGTPRPASRSSSAWPRSAAGAWGRWRERRVPSATTGASPPHPAAERGVGRHAHRWPEPRDRGLHPC